MSMIEEATLSVDNFNQPKKLLNEEAVGIQIARLIMMEKGKIQTHPDMGVGIRSRYRYAEASEMIRLNFDIKSQIEDYLPLPYSSVDVNCRLISKVVIIDILADEELFRFTYDQQKNIFELSEIKN